MATLKERPKEVSFLNKSFTGFRSDLVEFAKTYFPQSYADFNESSPGMMFIEMASYVGDVLSFYIDEQFRESLLVYAEERKTVFDIAQSYGYRPTISSPSSVTLDVYQTVPAAGTGDNVTPDYSYGYRVKQGSAIGADTFSTAFRMIDEVNFQTSGALDPVTVSMIPYEIDDNTPTKFLLKKKARAVSGDITIEKFDFGTPKAYDSITLGNKNVLEIISVTDSDGNKWYEVESLAQDLIFDEIVNDAEFDPNLAAYNETTPYLMKMIRTKNRFKTRVKHTGETQLSFGSGTFSGEDDEIIPNPSTVGNSFTNTNFLNSNSALDPANFLDTAVYGKAPGSTSLIIKYSYGGGVDDNVPANSIINKHELSLAINSSGLDTTLLDESKNSIAFNNSVPATGGRGEESINEIKENAKQYFQAQNRTVSKEDYITRVYSLPSKYGNIAKVFITQDDQLNSGENVMKDQVITQEVLDEHDGEIQMSKLQVRVPNPMALNFYVLGYDNEKKLTKVNEATKRNIRTYLGPYRILTDAINLKDGYVINVGVRFSLYTKKGVNKQEVILKAIQKVKEYFDVDKWQINQPIILSDIAYEISLVEGVNSVVPPQNNNPNGDIIIIENKFLSTAGYSGNIYDMNAATTNGVVYPSLDPSIFEIKKPDVDIVGKVLGDY